MATTVIGLAYGLALERGVWKACGRLAESVIRGASSFLVGGHFLEQVDWPRLLCRWVERGTRTGPWVESGQSHLFLGKLSSFMWWNPFHAFFWIVKGEFPLKSYIWDILYSVNINEKRTSMHSSTFFYASSVTHRVLSWLQSNFSCWRRVNSG